MIGETKISEITKRRFGTIVYRAVLFELVRYASLIVLDFRCRSTWLELKDNNHENPALVSVIDVLIFLFFFYSQELATFNLIHHRVHSF